MSAGTKYENKYYSLQINQTVLVIKLKFRPQIKKKAIYFYFFFNLQSKI